MGDFMSFKRMITPIIIQVLFWLLVAAVIIAGVVTILQGDQPLLGVALIIVGPVVVRIYAEILMVLFRINETLTEVGDTLRSIENNTRHPVA